MVILEPSSREPSLSRIRREIELPKIVHSARRHYPAGVMRRDQLDLCVSDALLAQLLKTLASDVETLGPADCARGGDPDARSFLHLASVLLSSPSGRRNCERDRAASQCAPLPTRPAWAHGPTHRLM